MLTSDALDAFAREYYLNDRVATIDLEERAQLHSVPKLVDAIDGRAPVLEMGFGTGLIAAELLDHRVPVQVVEGSPVLAAEARRRHPGLQVHEAMFETFTPDQSYGAVLALHVLEHVDDPVALLQRMRGWLSDDGALVAVVPNAESLHRRIAVEMGLHAHLDDLSPADHLVGHRRVYDLERLTADLDAAGFDVDLDFGYLLKTVPNAMMLDYPPEMVEALNTISDRIPTRDLANIGVRAIPRRIGTRPTMARRRRAAGAPAVLTALVLADGDERAAAMTAATLEGLADETLVLDRSEVDWGDPAVTADIIDAVDDQWILVVAAGERVKVTEAEIMRSGLRQSTERAIAVHIGLSTEVRLHRTGPDAMHGIGSAGGEPSRDLAIAPAATMRSGDPAVSVIVPTFNRPHLLRRCLQGLCVQTTDDFEVIVVNDGGIDVGSVVDEFRDRLDIAAVTQPHNGGAATAANAGLGLARGRYAHFQADDDTVHPHHLQLLIGAIDASQDSDAPAGVVFGPAWMLTEDERGEIRDREVLFAGAHEPERLMWQNIIVGGTAIFDRDLARSIGGMNTDYEVLEDWDFWLRLSKRAPIHYVDVPTAEYRMRAGTDNVTTQARPRFFDALLRLYDDHPCSPDSGIERHRREEIDHQGRSHRDDYAWGRTLAIVGNGDAAALGRALEEAFTTDDGSTQLIVHEVRTPETERMLTPLVDEAIVCLHPVMNDQVCRERIRRQAGGRTVQIVHTNAERGVGRDPQPAID